MADSKPLISDFQKYATLLQGVYPPAISFTPRAESATAVQVERGVIFSRVQRDGYSASHGEMINRLIEQSSDPNLRLLAVVDASGHHRSVYRGLLIYSWLQAYRIVYETLPRIEFGRWEEGIRPWCDLLEAELGEIEWPEGDAPIPATRGASAAEAVWSGLALQIAGKVYVRDAWTDLASHTFGQITRRQQPGGTFLAPESTDNPEPMWYYELAILHAATSYAVQTEDRHVASAVQRATMFHFRETQPDHASTQPWGLFAFLWNPETRHFADEMLHAVKMQSPAGVDGVALMLLADALYCVKLFL